MAPTYPSDVELLNISDSDMDFLEWLADELAAIDDKEIEIGFDEDTSLDTVIKDKGEK